MKKRFLTLSILILFVLGFSGCANVETVRGKCPHCGNIFSVQSMPPDYKPYAP